MIIDPPKVGERVSLKSNRCISGVVMAISKLPNVAHYDKSGEIRYYKAQVLWDSTPTLGNEWISCSELDIVPDTDRTIQNGDRVCLKNNTDVTGTVIQSTAKRKFKVRWDNHTAPGFGDSWFYPSDLDIVKKFQVTCESLCSKIQNINNPLLCTRACAVEVVEHCGVADAPKEKLEEVKVGEFLDLVETIAKLEARIHTLENDKRYNKIRVVAVPRCSTVTKKYYIQLRRADNDDWVWSSDQYRTSDLAMRDTEKAVDRLELILVK